MDVVQNVEAYHPILLETSSPTATNAKNYFPWDRMTDGFSAESAFLVSYSEIQTYRQCERRHYYGFFKKWAPAIQTTPIQLGTLGHKLLEIYFDSRDDPEVSISQILENIASYYTTQYMALIENGVRSNVLVAVYERVIDFIRNDPFSDYNVIAVEETMVTPLTPMIGLAYTPDLILEHKHTKQIKVVDHKFVGRPWSSTKLMMTTQLDIYAAALHYHNIHPTNKIYNFMGTNAPIPSPIEEFAVNDYKAHRIFDELLQYAESIHRISEFAPESQDFFSTRVLDPPTCQWCPFLDICYGELTGNERIIERATKIMVPNTYGYRKEKNN